MCILDISNLSVNIKNKIILKNINLKIKLGELHIIMGPNGSGKSTLSLTIAGHKKYKISKGSIFFKKKDISHYSIDQRAKNGLFISFQNNICIPNLNNQSFLQISVNSIRKYNNKKEFNSIEFKILIHRIIKKLNFSKDLLQRGLNKNFSGGEKKKNEILQMILLQPKLIILDEIDSGLDIDTLKNIFNIINKFKQKRSFLIITHYQKIFNYINPNFIHILYNGKIIYSGKKKINKILEKKGFEWFKKNIKKYK